jgi:anti-sigma factor (TIGR02949 family)
MIRADCDSVRDDLDAFADGELRGDELRYVSQHIDSCIRCTEEVEIRRTVGGLIRESASQWRQQPPEGLASGVVTQVRTESSLSWRAVFSRGVEDWHWIIVGGGAVTATFVSTLFCSALLLLGTATPRADSLSAMVTNLQTSPGQLYAEVSRQGAFRTQSMLVQLVTSAEPVGAMPDVLAREGEERQWVALLAQSLAGGGPLGQLAAMPEKQRIQTEWLLDNIARMRSIEPAVGPMNTLNVYRLHLVTTTEVTAKGLRP